MSTTTSKRSTISNNPMDQMANYVSRMEKALKPPFMLELIDDFKTEMKMAAQLPPHTYKSIHNPFIRYLVEQEHAENECTSKIRRLDASNLTKEELAIRRKKIRTSVNIPRNEKFDALFSLYTNGICEDSSFADSAIFMKLKPVTIKGFKNLPVLRDISGELFGRALDITEWFFTYQLLLFPEFPSVNISAECFLNELVTEAPSVKLNAMLERLTWMLAKEMKINPKIRNTRLKQRDGSFKVKRLAIKWDPFELCKLLMKQFCAQVEESGEQESHDETSEEKQTITSDETFEIGSEVDNSDSNNADECENEPEFSGGVNVGAKDEKRTITTDETIEVESEVDNSDYDVDVECENKPEFSGKVLIGANDEKRTIAIAIAAKKPIESDADNSDRECANKLEVSAMCDYDSDNDKIAVVAVELEAMKAFHQLTFMSKLILLEQFQQRIMFSHIFHDLTECEIEQTILSAIETMERKLERAKADKSAGKNKEKKKEIAERIKILKKHIPELRNQLKNTRISDQHVRATELGKDRNHRYYWWFRCGPNRKAIYIEERAFLGFLSEADSNEDSDEPIAGCSSQNTEEEQNKMVHGRFQDFIEGNMPPPKYPIEQWYSIRTEQELKELQKCLNPNGVREGALKEQLKSLKSAIVSKMNEKKD